MPLDFPVRPSPHELKIGLETYVAGRGLERLYRNDRQVVGTWFDGRRRREADHIVWISPSLVARWLGYLEAREKWPAGELERRWERLRTEIGGKLTFVVRLCSMPRIDPVETEIDQPAEVADSKQVRFLWTAGKGDWPAVRPREGTLGLARAPYQSDRQSWAEGLRAEPRSLKLVEFQSRSSEAVMSDDWWRRVPFGEPLQPEFSPDLEPPGLPLGDFYSTTYLLQVPIAEVALPAGRFELRVFSARKERVARYSLFPYRSRG